MNEDSEVFSPTQERAWARTNLESGVRLWRTNTEQSTASLDSYLAQNVLVKQRQLSDSWILNNKGTASVFSNSPRPRLSYKTFLESNTCQQHEGWISPKSSTSRSRPLQLCQNTVFSCSSSSSMDEDDKSETLVPQSSVSPSSVSSPSESLPSFAISSSSTYGTPDPSPLLSPQVSFYSCRSSLTLASPVDTEAQAAQAAIHQTSRSKSFKHVKVAHSESER